VAAGLGAVVLAVAAGVLAAARPRPAPVGAPSGTAVLVAARDLPAGSVPAAVDLHLARLPADAVPADALAAGVPPGAPLVVALRRGDLVTRRDVGGGPVAPAAGLRGYALEVGDGVEAGPLVPGDRVDVLAANGGAVATVLATVPVLRVVPGDQGRAAMIVLGVTAKGAETLAAARAAGSVTLIQAP